MTAETALAKNDAMGSALALKPAHNLETLAENFREASRHGHLLSPIIAVDQVPPFHQISMRAVVVDATIPSKRNGDTGMGTGPECYRDPRFCEADEVALGKNALMKIMAAAGIQVIEETRLDDRTDPHYCNIQVRLAWTDMDGLLQQRVASKEIDLREGSPGTMQPEKDGQGKKTGKMVPMQQSAIADKRRNIAALCETEAILRGVRSILALAQKYKVTELDKPFFVPKLVPFLDTTDPDQRAVALGRMAASQSSLYGPSAPSQQPNLKIIDTEPLEPGQAPEPQTLTPEEFVDGLDQPKPPEPWEQPPVVAAPKDPPPSPRKLPLPVADLSAVPSERRSWCVRLNELVQEVYDRNGAEMGKELLFKTIPADFDPSTSPASDVAKVGAALKALV